MTQHTCHTTEQFIKQLHTLTTNPPIEAERVSFTAQPL